ncbi:FG-GAP repeat domain-containing protein [Singulisphaera sp. PoT]|uniref:FG-GAP repeat domain-containing protein n=1 Tax=Singulisphaera sp. PoT TaxID=3411797 RepID=UPI003BF4E0EC
MGEAMAWALGGALGAVAGAGGIVAGALGAAIGGAGASVASSFLAQANLPSTVTLTIPVASIDTDIENASTLDDLGTNITGTMTEQWNNILTTLNDTTFIQSVLSNYGLLLALGKISGEPLASSALSPEDVASSLLTRTSWSTMIPAVFNWKSSEPYGFATGNGQTTNLSDSTSYSLAGATGPEGIAVGNFNSTSDSYSDLVVTDFSTDQVSVLLGQSDGSFQSSTPLGLGGPNGPSGVAVGDVNGDGYQDIIVADTSSDVVTVLKGDGSGNFSVEYNLGLGGQEQPAGLAVADLNGDGRPDIAVANGLSGSISLLLNNGNGFDSPATIALGSGYQPVAIAAVPLRGSIFPNLVVTYNQFASISSGVSAYGGVGLLLSNGPASYDSPVYYPISGATSATSLIAEDLDGDGLAELAITNIGNNAVDIISGTTVGNFATFQPGSVGPDQLAALLGQIQSLQGGNAVNVGPYDSTSQITPGTTSPPPYLGYFSLPYAPGSGPPNVAAPGDFLAITPAQLSESASGYSFNQGGSIVTAWTLTDGNGNPIAPETASQLFGIPASASGGSAANSGVNLTPIDPQHPFVALNGGWYYAAAAPQNAAATWADVFFNWGQNSSSDWPRNLIPSYNPNLTVYTNSGTLPGTSESFPSDFSYTVTYSPQTTAPPSVGTTVNLASAFNRVGIVADGTTFGSFGGLDGDGNALSAQLLGGPVAWNSLLFNLGATGASNAIAASGQTIALPRGSFDTLSFLGSGVNGNQADVNFTITYADGTTQTFTQSLSDWHSPQNYAGESTAVTMAYRDVSGGTIQSGSYYVYGYQFTLKAGKAVRSITLLDDGNVTILGMTLS